MGVDGDLIDLHELIQSGVSGKDELEYFNDAKYRFKNLTVAQDFFNFVTYVHNHTRMFHNNGFTPYEILEMQARNRWNPSPISLGKH